MDGLTIAVVAAGAAVGVLTGLVPGLHVNTLAAVALAILVVPGAHAVLFLVAVGTVHTIVNILPATYLGVPDEDDALVVLPAHRLLAEGRGPDAVTASVWASLAALVAAVAVAPAYRWVLLGPPGLLAFLDSALPVVLGLAIATLLWTEKARGARAMAWAAFIIAASGALGWLSFTVPMRPLVAGAPSALLPLLGGLFGGAGLVASLRRPAPVPMQWRPGRPPPVAAAVGMGGLAAAFTAVLPGLTAAVATSMVPRRDDPVEMVAALSTVNTAHAVLALHVLVFTGRIRTGLADVVQRGLPHDPWPGGAPGPALADLLAATLAAGVLGAVATLWLGTWWGKRADRVPARHFAAAALVVLTLMVLALTGWTGLLLYAAATTLGLVPILAGVRRAHLVGCLAVPVLIRSLL